MAVSPLAPAAFPDLPVIDGVTRFGYPFDLSWTGPYWLPARSLPHANPWLAYPVALALLACVYLAATKLWERMGAAAADRSSRHGTQVVSGVQDSA